MFQLALPIIQNRNFYTSFCWNFTINQVRNGTQILAQTSIIYFCHVFSFKHEQSISFVSIILASPHSNPSNHGMDSSNLPELCVRRSENMTDSWQQTKTLRSDLLVFLRVKVFCGFNLLFM